MMESVLLSPHNDDETLFAAYTLIRERPLVLICTDSYVQYLRGDGITPQQRKEETLRAAGILGVEVLFLGLSDHTLTDSQLRMALQGIHPQRVYAPAIQGGHAHHDMVGRVAKELWPHSKHYTTYTKTDLYTTGTTEIAPTPEEVALKNRALDCYVSQIRINRPHFDAVRGKSEWLL